MMADCLHDTDLLPPVQSSNSVYHHTFHWTTLELTVHDQDPPRLGETAVTDRRDRAVI